MTIGPQRNLSGTTSTDCPARPRNVVIDTSALVALLGMEAEAARVAVAIESDASRLISAATLVEAGVVVESRYGSAGARELDLLVAKAGFVVESITAEQADVAREAWRRYGKGRHSAGLNFSDCFSYALAKVKGEPLLSTGEDFPHTDITAAAY
jgi:ribonuclease VapC